MAQVVITGANRGIGLALAREYARKGDGVLALCRSPSKAESLQTLAEDTNGRIQLGRIDIGDLPSIEAAVQLVRGPVDILINNAGIDGGSHQTLSDVDYNAWIEAFSIMAIGPFRVVKSFLPLLERAQGAKVMTVSSILSTPAWPLGGHYIYGSAKAAGNRIMQILAVDLRERGISVAYIHPGWVQTDMGGPNAEITPTECALGISNVIAKLSPGDSGKFFRWDGDIQQF